MQKNLPGESIGSVVEWQEPLGTLLLEPISRGNDRFGILDSATHSTGWISAGATYSAPNEYEDPLTRVMGNSALNREFGKRISEILELHEGWDGPGTKAVSRDLLAEALETIVELLAFREDCLDRLYLFPTLEGGVLLEWTTEARNLEAELGFEGWSFTGTAYGSDPTLNQYYTGDARLGASNVVPFYRWFLGESELWPSE